MSAEWPVRAIGEICQIVNGGTPKTSVSAYWDGPHQWVTPAEMGRRESPYIDRTKRSLSDAGIRDSSARMLPAHSVILSSRAPIGHLAINTVPMATNQGCKGLIPNNGLSSKFLYYFLSANVDLLNALGTGTTFKELSGARLKEVKMPLPPLAEQQRIVGILDEAFEGITTAKANAEFEHASASELFERRRDEILFESGVGVSPLREFADRVEYGTSAKSSRRGDIPVLRMGNIQNGRLDWKDLVYTDDKAEIERYSLRAGDVLFNRTNSPELVGKSALYQGERPAIFAGYLIRIHLRAEKMLSAFLVHCLNSRRVRDHGRTVMSGSVNQANISGSKLMEYPIPAQTLDEQSKAIGALDALEAEIHNFSEVLESKLAALEALKQSLLHHAFTGQL